MYEKETLADLEAVRELISDPGNWVQCSIALNPAGFVVDPTDPKACRFCLLGAMYKVTGRIEWAARENNARYYRLRDAFSLKNSLSSFNDRVTHSEVLAMLDADIVAFRQKVT